MPNYPVYSHDEVLGMLWSIPPDSLSYDEMLRVTAASLSAGVTEDEALSWCRQSPNFDERESLKHIRSLKPEGGSTIGTLIYYAQQNGWRRGTTDAVHPRPKGPTTPAPAKTVTPMAPSAPKIDPPHTEVPEPLNLTPEEELVRYLSALFHADEQFELVTESKLDGGKWHPSVRGGTLPVASAVATIIEKADEGISKVFKGNHPEAGIWVGVNPLSKGGSTDKDVTAYRFTLLESDKMEKSEQVQFYHDHHIPCAAIVDSGGKSVHAIVRIDAKNRDEYDNRVRQLHDYCEENGFELDRADKNPSRLTRLPGVKRGEERQRLLYLNTGARNFDEWRSWVEDMKARDARKLPVFVPIADIIGDNLLDSAPELISNLFSAGSKMLIAAPSKAGKSFLAIELAIAFAAGIDWLGFNCTRSRVLYINLELKESTFAQRVDKVLNKMGLTVQDIEGQLATWHLRGRVANMQQINDELAQITSSDEFDVVIIDPIYKVTNGDENSAQEMTWFTNELDRLYTTLNCAIVGVHHFSKGAKGKYDAMDRPSGSGVFARDADVLVTLTPLELPATERGNAGRAWLDSLGNDARPYRVEFTVREFRTPEPFDIAFSWPLHHIDQEGVLGEATIIGSTEAARNRGAAKHAENCKAEHDRMVEAIVEALVMCETFGEDPDTEHVFRHLKDSCKKRGLKMISHATFSNYLTPGRQEWPFYHDPKTHFIVYEDPTGPASKGKKDTKALLF